MTTPYGNEFHFNHLLCLACTSCQSVLLDDSDEYCATDKSFLYLSSELFIQHSELLPCPPLVILLQFPSLGAREPGVLLTFTHRICIGIAKKNLFLQSTALTEQRIQLAQLLPKRNGVEASGCSTHYYTTF